MKNILFLLVLLSSFAYGQINNGVTVYGGIVSVSSAPSGSCAQGVANQQVVTNGVQYSCQNIVSGVGTWGVIPGGSSATATSISGGSVGAQPYQTAASTTAFVYPATNVNAFNLDGNRTDSYTPDGTPERPYKTLSSLFAAVASVTGPFVINSIPMSSAYTYTGNVSLPAYQMTINGNGSAWQITGNATVNAPYYITYLQNVITGTLTYASSSSQESVRLGGGLQVGGGVTTNGYEHFFDMSILGNTIINVNPGSNPVFTNVVGTPLIKTGLGATAATVVTIIDSESLATGAYTNVDMSNGGLAVIRGFIATNNNTVANINLSGSSGSSSTIASELAGVSAAWLAAGTSYVYIDNGSVYGVMTGTHLLVPNGLGMSSPAANTMIVKSGTTGAATFDSGTTGTVNVGTGANAKTVTIGNNTGATALVLNAGTLGTAINSAVTAGAINYAAGGGAAQAQTVTLSPALTSNLAGNQVNFLPSVANTATAPTLSVNGLTALPITVCGTSAVLAGDLSITTIANVVSDGTHWQLKNPNITNCGTVVNSLQAGSGTPLVGAVINATQSNVGTTTQINVQNTSNDNAASSDLVATSDNGNQTSYFIDAGCNSSTYSQAAYNTGGADDCYLYSSDGNLNIATAHSGKVITFNVGGTTTTQTVATLNTTGLVLSGSESAATHLTATNCTSSAAPAVCAAAAAGSVVVAAAGTTVVVNTTAVTANSQIFVQEDSSLGAKLSVTCNTTPATAPSTVSARVAATSFTITTTAPTTNPRCFSYFILN